MYRQSKFFIRQAVLLWWTFTLPPTMKSPIVADAAQSPSDWKD